MRVRWSHVSQMAAKVLQAVPEARTARGGIDPRVIAERYGITVRESELDDKLSGFLIRDEEGRAFIGVNQSNGEARKRFTTAHELGHFFLHDHTTPFIDDLTGRFKVLPRDEVSGEGTDVREIEANRFAAEILMPETMLREDIEGHGHVDLFHDDDDPESVIKTLAEKYGVSVRAMTIRLERLGYVSEI
jgi:Zn-dependent peptidase ImmA (M78 family)